MQASLEDLNRSLPSAIDMNRFRANILLGGGGLAPWEEDSWQEVEFGGGEGEGGAKLELIKPCSRCTVRGLPDTACQVCRARMMAGLAPSWSSSLAHGAQRGLNGSSQHQ